MNSTVKPEELFQLTKQKILKNKQQFIQIHLSQFTNKIAKLKSANTKLKQQIKQLKQPKSKSIITKNKIMVFNKTFKQNNKDESKDRCGQKDKDGKQNLCVNINNKNQEQFYVHNTITQRNRNLQKQQIQLKQVEEKIKNQEKQKQKQLEYFQDYIKMLKKIWQDKQNKQHYTTKKWQSSQNNYDSVDNFTNQNYPTDQGYNKQSKNMASALNQKDVTIDNSLNCSSLNSSLYAGNLGHKNDNTFGKAQVKRKTMSLSLNNSMQAQQSIGFNFGKKLTNKVNLNQPLQVTHLTSKLDYDFQRPSILFQNSIRTRQSQNLNSSFLSNSQSYKINLQRSSKSNTSQIKRIQASKSYAKIITKLQCATCHIQYRPNQYYVHLNQCRQMQKIKLLNEKSRIQDQINQTLNLSLEQL